MARNGVCEFVSAKESESIWFNAKTLSSSDCERDWVTKDPLVSGQQLVAPEEAGSTGKATC